MEIRYGVQVWSSGLEFRFGVQVWSSAFRLPRSFTYSPSRLKPELRTCAGVFTYSRSRLKPELHACPRSFTYSPSRLKPELKTSLRSEPMLKSIVLLFCVLLAAD